jgi:hypothetical protein
MALLVDPPCQVSRRVRMVQEPRALNRAEAVRD